MAARLQQAGAAPARLLAAAALLFGLLAATDAKRPRTYEYSELSAQPNCQSTIMHFVSDYLSQQLAGFLQLMK